MQKSRCVPKWLHNLFFMKVAMLNVRSFSTDPITLITIISASFMYFERLRTIDMEILHQSLIRGMSWSFSCNVVSELCNIIILK
jgi:hypothetical protein